MVVGAFRFIPPNAMIFDTLDCDDEEEIKEFCNDFINDDFKDNFTVVNYYINDIEQRNEKFYRYLELNTNTKDLKHNVIAWHISASILGIHSHSLEMNAVYELRKRIVVENSKIDLYRRSREQKIAHDYLDSNIPFFYRKSLVRVIKHDDIGNRLSSMFIYYNLQYSDYIEKSLLSLYRSFVYSNWIHNKGMSVLKTDGFVIYYLN